MPVLELTITDNWEALIALLGTTQSHRVKFWKLSQTIKHSFMYVAIHFPAWTVEMVLMKESLNISPPWQFSC